MVDRPSIAEALAEYDRDHAFAQHLLPPDEDRALLALPWSGGHAYRWFRSPNVVPLEKVRMLRAQGRI